MMTCEETLERLIGDWQALNGGLEKIIGKERRQS